MSRVGRIPGDPFQYNGALGHAPHSGVGSGNKIALGEKTRINRAGGGEVSSESRTYPVRAVALRQHKADNRRARIPQVNVTVGGVDSKWAPQHRWPLSNGNESVSVKLNRYGSN